jgi:hypothetical protein
VVVLTRLYDALKRIQQDTDAERVITTSIKDYRPQATRLLYTMLRERKEAIASDSTLWGQEIQRDFWRPPERCSWCGSVSTILGEESQPGEGKPSGTGR